MISTTKFWTVSAGLFLAGLAGSAATVAWHSSSPAAPRSQAAWAFEAQNPGALARYAESIVLAQVVATYPGRVATSANGEDLLPFQIVELHVQNALKGSFPDGRVYVERAGGREPGTGVEHVIDIDGGEFDVGGTYLLFLNEQPGDTGLYYQVNDQARYELVGERLRSIEGEPDRVQQAFDRRTPAEASAFVRQLLEQ